jgi:hypothetical protein
MVKRSSKRKKKEHDFAVTAFRIVQEATGEDVPAPEEERPPKPDPDVEGKNPHAVALGRLGGKKGGRARADKLTPEQRREIARKAAAARWRR